MATEIEIKLLLATLQDYVHVLTALDAVAPEPVSGVAQVNYYLDTAQRELHAQRAMARVRVADGHVLLTVKVQPSLRDGVMRVSELEASLPTALAAQWRTAPPARCDMTLDAQGWLRDPLVLARPLPADAVLHCLGAMHNTRRKYLLPAAVAPPDSGGILLELDRVHYGAGGDQAERFEIEVETPNAAAIMPLLQQWLDELGVDWALAEESKYAQFLRLSERAEAA